MDFVYGMNQQHVLEEDYDENYEPTEEEILEYCKVLDLDPVAEKDLMYIAREGIKAPLPDQWKPVEEPGGGIYYFNFKTGASTWEHPCDEFYRNLLKQEREKKKRLRTAAKTKSSSTPRKKKSIKIGSVKKNPPSVANRMGVGNGIVHGRGGIDPGDGEVHPAQLMSGTTSLAARSHMPSTTFHGGKGGGLSSAAQVKLGEAPLGKLQGSPVHGRLVAPLSVGGNKPLPSIGGLPMLKTPAALAPLHVPSGMSQTGSSLGGSLGSTGGSGESTRRSTDPLGNTYLRNVELGNIGISNEFEEEDGNEESKSESDLGGGFNKIGMNLMGAEDLGLKDTEDSTDDVSKELRKIMEQSEGSDNNEDAAANEFLRRPMGLSIGAPQTSLQVSAEVGGANIKGRAKLGGDIPSLSPRPQRPNAAKFRDRSYSNKEKLNEPSTPVKSSSQQVAPLAGSAPGNVAMKPHVKVTTPQSETIKEAQLLVTEHAQNIENLKQLHTEELAKLRQQFALELEDLKKSLVSQNEASLDAFRKKLASEQVSEEKQLRTQKETFLSELRARIKEEGDEEEAKLVETQQDAIRKLKQQIAIEQEREERQLKETKERTLSNLRKQLQEQQSKEESLIRSSSTSEVAKLKERLGSELAVEKKKIESSHEEEIQRMKDQAEEELKEKKDALEKEHQKQREVLQSIEKEKQKALEEARIELEKTHNLEDFKAKALQTHKQALEEIEAEFARELEEKKVELNEQHQTEIAELKEKLARELDQLRKEENEKLNLEKKRFTEQLKSAKDVLTQDHESKMQQVRAEYECQLSQLQQLKEKQLQEIASLKAEYEAQCEELSQAKCDAEQQTSELESRRRQLEAKQAEIEADEERLEKLRSANAEETEQLLQKQQVELRKDVEKERKRLNSLKKSCGELEKELQQLSKQQEVCLVDLEGLKEEEKSYRSQLSDLKSQIKGQRNSPFNVAKAAHKTDAKNSYSTARNGENTEVVFNECIGKQEMEKFHLSNGFTHVAKIKAKKLKPTPSETLEDRDESESEEEEGVDMTAGSMDLAALAQSSLKHKVANGFSVSTRQQLSDSEDSSVLLDTLQSRLTERNRELQLTLMAEQDSLVKTKAYLKKQQDALKQRRVALRQAHMDWSGGLKSSKTTKGTASTSDDGNMSLMRDIRCKLDQEAAALNELEKRMKTSNCLLARKEQAINRLQASLADEIEKESEAESESTSSPPPPLEMNLDFDIPSPRTYLARLRASLEKSRKYTNSQSKHLLSGLDSSKKRTVTPALPFKVSSFLSDEKEMAGGHVGGKDSDSDLSSLSSSSSSTSLNTADLRGGQTVQSGVASKSLMSQSPNQYRLSPATKRVTGGHMTTLDQNVHLSTNGAPPLSRLATYKDHTTVLLSGRNSPEGRNDIMSSLQTINGRLGELLSRINPQSFTASAEVSDASGMGVGVTPHIQSRYAPSPAPFVPGDIGRPRLQSTALLNTSEYSQGRWADPVPHVDHMEVELQRKRQSYLSTHQSPSQPLGSSHPSRFDSSSLYHPPSTMPRPQLSTEALMRNQTDWLKEFRQTVPLSSQLKLGASGGYSKMASPNLTSSQLRRSSTAPRVGTSAIINDASVSSTMNGEARSHLPSSAGSNLLPSKPRLVLDSSSNVQLLRL